MNIFVSNIGCHVTSEDLYGFFAPFGKVDSARLITDQETGKSLRYGFVEMPGEQSAGEAISKLHGKIIEGRTMSVSISKTKSAEQTKYLLGKKQKPLFSKNL